MARTISNPYSIEIAPAPPPSPPPPPPLPPPPPGRPAWLTGTAAMTWGQIAGSAFTAVNVEPPLPQSFYRQGPRTILDNWGGLAFWKGGKTLIAKGGGHFDYAGNEVKFIRLGDAAPVWQIKRGFSDPSAIQTNVRRYLDGRVTASHSYTSIYFNEARGEFFEHGPAAVWGDGNFGARFVERFDWFGSGDWMPVEQCPAIPSASTPTAPGVGKCLHPATGDIYWLDTQGAALWRTKAADYTTQQVGPGNPTSQSIYSSLAIDPGRNRLLRGPYYGDQGGWRVVDLATGVSTPITLTGYTGFTSLAQPTLWDARRDRFLVMTYESQLIAIDAATWAASLLAVAGTPPLGAGVRKFNKAAIVEDYDVLVYVPDATMPVYFVPLS